MDEENDHIQSERMSQGQRANGQVWADHQVLDQGGLTSLVQSYPSLFDSEVTQP